ncbi:MAG: hypothetical protein NZ602_02385 [Thermoguttaceae bacterium]|nr:hypothetical protein [Thermoguttaceae bacterium]MDW8037146.1 hypothetical protein [Thermoguttaceae bacterium]
MFKRRPELLRTTTPQTPSHCPAPDHRKVPCAYRFVIILLAMPRKDNPPPAAPTRHTLSTRQTYRLLP